MLDLHPSYRAYDWLRERYESSGPSTERCKAKPIQYRFILDVQLKIANFNQVFFVVWDQDFIHFVNFLVLDVFLNWRDVLLRDVS